jgi:hypothetical protein
VIVDKNIPVIFSTVNTNLEEVSFHAEGMSASGTLLSQTIKVSKSKSSD